MAKTIDTVALVLAAAVPNGGTFTLNYPTDRDAGAYTGGHDHQVVLNALGPLYALEGDVAFTFGTSNITVTNNSGSTIPANTRLAVQLDRSGQNVDDPRLANPNRMALLSAVRVNLGAPDAAVANGICASQAVSSGVSALLNGSLVAAGAGVFDTPRNVVAAWTTAAVVTVTGFDEYGVKMVESSASGTSFTGKKAFKRVTDVKFSANVTGATVGSGNVLGLPMYLGGIGSIVNELQDGVDATAGTTVAGVSGLATATSGDVRGTYTPNATPDGAKAFQLDVISGDPKYRGSPQYAV